MKYLILTIIIISLVGILMVPNAFAKEVIVQNAPGSSTPGCEETDSCFNPNPVRINVNDKITWENNDSAAHTVTSGGPITGPDGYFDSSLIMAGYSYSLTFPSVGTYDYFCMIHPWMVGKVIVKTSSSTPTVPPTQPQSSEGFRIIDIPNGATTNYDISFGTGGNCHQPDACFTPLTMHIDVGDTIKWENNDTLTHMIKSRNGYYDSYPIPPGQFFTKTFNQSGKSSYYCNIHPFMQGEIIVGGGIPSSSSTSKTFTKIILDSLPSTFKLQGSNLRSEITFSGKLVTADDKFYIPDAEIKLVFTDFTYLGKDHYKMKTDNDGKFNKSLQLPVGSNYGVQVVFDGDRNYAHAGSSKSQTEFFAVILPSSTPTPPQIPTSSSGGFEWISILILLGVGAGVAAIFIKKNKKKTSRPASQRKTFGAKQPKKRRTVGSPVGVPSSVDGPSTYGYFECPNCHEPSAPQGKLGQNTDGSQFCPVCGWKS